MAADHRALVSRIEEIVYEEQRAIRKEVDAEFFQHGWTRSPELLSASARVLAVGMGRAVVKIADEIWTRAETKAPGFAADANRAARHLRIRMIGYYRQRLMSGEGRSTPEETVSACRELSWTLHDICNRMVDDVVYRSKPLAASPLPEAPGLDARAAEAPRRIRRQAGTIDLDRLPSTLSEVRSSIGASVIDKARRRALLNQLEAIEAFARLPNPHQEMLLSMVRRLPPALKLARLDLAGSLVESLIEQDAATLSGPQ
jgi:hypothetical protein